MKIIASFAASIISLSFAGCHDASHSTQAPPSVNDFVWRAEIILPDRPQFRQFGPNFHMPEIQAELEAKLAEIVKAHPEQFGTVELYFAFSRLPAYSARLLVVSSKPLSASSRASLAPLRTLAQSEYDYAHGIAP